MQGHATTIRRFPAFCSAGDHEILYAFKINSNVGQCVPKS